MQTNRPLASREEIRAFVEKEYPELTGGRISIGLLGDHYRVVVEDASHVLHTIHIPLETQRLAPIAKFAGPGAECLEHLAPFSYNQSDRE